jgi:hypothetical protein
MIKKKLIFHCWRYLVVVAGGETENRRWVWPAASLEPPLFDTFKQARVAVRDFDCDWLILDLQRRMIIGRSGDSLSVMHELEWRR